MSLKPNLLYIQGFIDHDAELMQALLCSVCWDSRMRARKTASFGEPYNYSGMTYPKVDFPDVLDAVLDRLEETLGFRPNNSLLNLYPDGDSRMGFHFDSTEELVQGTGVAIVSLGALRTLEFQKIEDRSVSFEQPLEPGSMLYMGDDVQRSWLHGIPRDVRVASPRISCTFRRLKTNRTTAVHFDRK